MLRHFLKFSQRKLSQLSSAGVLESLQIQEAQFQKYKEFLDFVKLIQRFQDYEDKISQKRRDRDEKLSNFAHASPTPLKHTLTLFMENRNNLHEGPSYDSENIYKTLHTVARVLRSRNHNYEDLDFTSIQQNYKFLELIHDIKYGLQPGVSFPPVHLAQIIQLLGEIGYKESDLLDQCFLKVQRCLENTEPQFLSESNSQRVGFQPYNKSQQILSHLNSQKIKNFVQTIKDWKSQSQISYIDNDPASNLASSLYNLRNEWLQLLQESEKRPNDNWLKLQLLELQESIVKAGIISPQEFQQLENFVDLEKRMANAEQTFISLSQQYFPHLLTEQQFQVPYTFQIHENAEGAKNNQWNIEQLANLLQGFARYMNSIPKEIQMNQSQQQDLHQTYNEVWIKGHDYVKQLRPKVIELLNNEFQQLNNENKIQVLCSLINAFSESKVGGQDLLKIIAAKIKELEAVEISQVDVTELSKAIFNLASWNQKQRGQIRILAQILQNRLNQLRAELPLTQELVYALVGFCIVELPNEPVFKTFLERLNQQQEEFIGLNSREKELLSILHNSLKLEVDSSIQIPQLSPCLSEIVYMEKLEKAKITSQPAKNFVQSQLDKVLQKFKSSIPGVDYIIPRNGVRKAFIIAENDCFIDNQVTGEQLIKQRHLEKQHYLQACPVNIENMVDKSKMILKEDILLEEIFGDKMFPEFAIMRQLAQNLVQSLQNEIKNQQFLDFAYLIIDFYGIQHQLHKSYTPEAQLISKLELKLQIDKILKFYQKAQQKTKTQITKLLPDNNLDEVLQKLQDSIKVNNEVPEKLPWMGLKSGIEIFGTQEQEYHDLSDQLLNQKFLWYSPYFHYKDWEQNIQEGLKPSLDYNFSFDNQFLQGQSMPLFQKDKTVKYQTGIVPKPDQKTMSGQQITSEQKMLISLLNIRNQLKRSFTDKQLIDTLLSLQFIQQIMEEHLSKPQPGNDKIQLVPRSLESYIEFQNNMETQETSNYIKFMKGLGQQEKDKEFLYIQLYEYCQAIDNRSDINAFQKLQLKNIVKKQVLSQFKQIRMQDPHSVEFFKNTPKTVTQFQINLENETSIFETDVQHYYLKSQRIKAETKLVKLAILKKLAEGGQLTDTEANYLNQWKKTLTNEDFQDIKSIMAPKEFTNTLIKDIAQDDLKFFNTLKNVSLGNVEQQYGLSDLILEISHFFDDDLIQKFENQFIQQNTLNKMGVSKETQEKLGFLEPSSKGQLVSMHRLEQYLQQQAAQIKFQTELNRMFSISRGRTTADQIQLQTDIKSLEDFIQDLNTTHANLSLDQKLTYLYYWFERKEIEHKYRNQQIFMNYQQSDKELWQNVFKSQLLKEDQELLKNQPIAYEDMTSLFLRKTIDNLKNQILGRTQIYKQDLQFAQAILRHPNITEQDREDLVVFLKRFKLLGDDYTGYAESNLLMKNPLTLVTQPCQEQFSLLQWAAKLSRKDLVQHILNKF